MNEKLYQLNVYLFAFHLRDRLTSGSSKQKENEKPEWLWQRSDAIFTELGIKSKFILDKSYCPPDTKNSQILTQPSVYDQSKENPQIYPYLLPERNISIPTQQSRNGIIKINGFACPQLLHDSYALKLRIGHPSIDENDLLEIPVLKEFNCNNCLLPDEIDSYLGQTLVITSRLTESQKQKKGKDDNFLKNLADECLNNFIGDEIKRPEYRCQDQLFGSPIFEYGKLIFNSSQAIHVNKYRHILIWFLYDDTVENNFNNKLREEFIYLFLYRNKIISTFLKSRRDYKSLYTKYQEIEEEVKNINENIWVNISANSIMSKDDLTNLKVKLKMLSKIALEYSRLLRNLEHHRNNIADNTHNYFEVIRSIGIKLNLVSEESLSKELSFLMTFKKENCIYFQERINSDLGYFGHGSSLLDKTIASIRGIVEIEQAEIDRSLERTIQILGAGLGAGGIVASAVSGHVDKPPVMPQENTQIHPAVMSIGLSVLAALFIGGFVGWMNGTIPKFSKTSNRSQISQNEERRAIAPRDNQ